MVIENKFKSKGKNQKFILVEFFLKMRQVYKFYMGKLASFTTQGKV